MQSLKLCLPLLIALVVATASRAFAAPTFMRYPNASATEVAFVAHGDLWAAPLQGGGARRLTHDPGEAAAPRFSPDGRWIAFTDRRAKGRDVYVIPAQGGEARRLTFDGPGVEGDDLVLGWTPDSRRIAFLSSHDSANQPQFRAYTVPVEGGAPQRLPLDRSGLLSFSPDGGSVAFTREFRDFELRKRYVGGQQQDVFTYDFAKHSLVRLTSWKGTDTAPMWAGHVIYFVSDRGAGFRRNIWAYDLRTRRTHQVTHFADYDVDWPSLGAGGVTFQQGGRLYVLDLPTEHLREILVDVPDDGERTSAKVASVAAQVRVSDALGGVDYALSPDGASLLVSAHGDVVRLSVGAAAANLTGTPGVDEDHPTWSPDAHTVAYTTDVGGEQQVAVRAAAGGAERLLTRMTGQEFYSAIWSPAGDRLAVADAHHELWLVPLDGSGPRRVAADPYAEIRDAVFSPDGRWLAFGTQRSTRVRALHLFEIATGADTVVSSPMESDRLPAFTADGRSLAFVSQRHELPFVSDRDDESLVSTLNSDGVYLAALTRDPTAARSSPPGAPLRVEPDGLMARAVELPVTPAVITSLEARGDELFYETKPPQLIGGDLPGLQPALHAFDLAHGSDRIVVAGLGTHSLSGDGAAVAFRRDGDWEIAPTRAGAPDPVKLDLTGLRLSVDPKLEWREMLENAWRLDRDVFFSAVMNGSDWPRVRKAYMRLAPLIGSQDDFLYVLGQMQGEIASSHTFIGRGAELDPRPREPAPRLGADFALNVASGRYRLARIYAGDQTRAELRGPLGAPGLGVREGDYLLAVNGRELRAPAAPLSVFAGQKGPLRLVVASTADGARREETVEPVEDDGDLRHLDWVRRNRATVDRLSHGRLGYIALSDFDDQGSKEFVRQFYPQLYNDGLVFDVRWNRGGFTSQAVLDVLRREKAGVFVNRQRAISPLPTATAPRVMAAIINAGSRSDGDQFPYYFRAYGLGPLIGERTWGGVQGINGPWRLMDGSFVLIPKDALADLHGRWIIENAGVAPDITVGNSPSAADGGEDAQLEAAVRACLAKLDRSHKHPPPAPPFLPAYPKQGVVHGASFGPGG